MPAEPPQLTVSRVFDAPRALVFRAFTDPDQLATWWGPTGSSVLREEAEFDVRPGGFQRWTEVAAAQPDVRVRVHLDLADVADGELLEGVLRVSGRLPGGFEPFDTRFRIEFHDVPDGRTRLEIRQWLPTHLAGPTNQGWAEGFEKLDATLRRLQAAPAEIEV
jgi:uncharacterized protein YndB with AHSA1/START domain